MGSFEMEVTSSGLKKNYPADPPAPGWPLGSPSWSLSSWATTLPEGSKSQLQVLDGSWVPWPSHSLELRWGT